MILLTATISPDRWTFIWGSYGVFLLVFIMLIVLAIAGQKSVKQRLKHYYKRKALLKNTGNENQLD
ncbi:heme exporter protein CcmD [Pleionea mediterranea]|uniref:Heme exporter protein D n=1 Tax=Pleionea mediterranea TaxID=523701 RepID=A0A316FQP1_9GAMM|nr:heme exporter protein CcmD [Pleionea mediterranea]PWK49970.1 heme exporter protein CcmD [Pleionea mediterranea]